MQFIPLVLVLFLGACASSADQTRYEIASGKAEWLDHYRAAKRECESSGGVIMKERHERDSLRIGSDSPEPNTRYWCAY